MQHNTPSPRPTTASAPEGLRVRTRVRAGIMGGNQAGGAGGLGGIGRTGFSGTIMEGTDI